MLVAPFTVIEPSGTETPVVVEVPHAGIYVDPPALAFLVAPAQCLARDADLYVDELYADAPTTGATLLAANVSRYVVDLNRSEQDVDRDSVEGAPADARATRGIVWRLTSDGARVLEKPLPRAELERRLELFYRPYHATLSAIVQRKLERFGRAVVVAAHSMPSVGRTDTRLDATATRADVVPGTRRRTSADAVFIDAVEAHARAAQLTVAHDDPYQGGFTTQFYGRPRRGVHVIQVELARRLYMNESSLAKSARFPTTKAWCTELGAKLGAAALRHRA